VSSEHRRTPLVIGYGNPLRTDDGFGWQLARHLHGVLPEGVATVLAVHQLTPELAEPISAASYVLFVDVSEDGRAGEIVWRPLSAALDWPSTFSHEVQPQALVALAQTLYGRCPPAGLVSVGGADFAYGDELSAAVQAAMPTALRQVLEVVGVGRAVADAGNAGRGQRA
jgi:hydrogenase maturation protease